MLTRNGSGWFDIQWFIVYILSTNYTGIHQIWSLNFILSRYFLGFCFFERFFISCS